MIVAGIMSGTSADGVDVALVRISGPTARSEWPAFRLLAHAQFPYSKAVREAILAFMNSPSVSVADLARLNFLLGEIYADAVLATQKKYAFQADLAGCHGQTLYHQGDARAFLGRKVAVTWQVGEGAVLAARLGIPVVSDFRPADIAAGGKGAPLVPFLDYILYHHPTIGRIAQNIGGIANLTAIPAGASPREVTAFDTGPGNMVMDALAQKLFGKPYDAHGQFAAAGNVLGVAIEDILRERFFRTQPPKTAGREEFGREFADRFLRCCGNASKEDVMATATALTARSITFAIRKFVLRPGRQFQDVIVSGGGSRNPTLMAMLANELRDIGLGLRSSEEFGLPSEAKEATAFALLAYQTFRHEPSNVPSATGARQFAILGKVSYA